LASGKVSTLPLVTARARLADWQGVFNAMVRQETIRTVFELEETA